MGVAATLPEFSEWTLPRGYRPDPPAIPKTVAPLNMKFCRVLVTYLNVLEILKFIVFT